MTNTAFFAYLSSSGKLRYRPTISFCKPEDFGARMNRILNGLGRHETVGAHLGWFAPGLYSFSFGFETWPYRYRTVNVFHDSFQIIKSSGSNVPNRSPYLTVCMNILDLFWPFLIEDCLKVLRNDQERWAIRKVRRLGMLILMQ